VTINAVVGQLFLKRALISLGGRATFASLPKFFVAAACSPWVYTSIAIQGVGYFLWMVLLSREKLGVATASVSAGFYILLALCAWAFYGEALSGLQWAGIAFIAVGVACMTVSSA
jgi:drug/metabolite transporter (DMT)-like permease